MVLPLDRFWTISNILSLIRIPIIAYGCYMVIIEADFGWVAVTATALIAIFTDFADGWIARKFNQMSEWGKILDPLADKICIMLVILTSLYMGMIPLWFVVIVILRDILISLGGIYMGKRIGLVPMSVMSGKLAALSVTITLLFSFLVYFLQEPWLGTVYSFLIGVSLVLLVYSFYEYAFRMQKELKKHNG